MAKQLWRSLDYFPTPPWAARAVAHRLRQLDPGAVDILEPACGEFHFAGPLGEVFGNEHVTASDIYDYGHGRVADFLTGTFEEASVDWIVTNPPFSKAYEFIERGLRVARRGVVLAPCRLGLLESSERQWLLYESEFPLTCLMPFVERVPMQLGSWDPDLSSAAAYGGFVFHKGREPMAPLPFKTGTKATYWRDSDLARFAKPEPIPLFENLAPPALLSTVGAGCKR
jgi:hypothetical protein